MPNKIARIMRYGLILHSKVRAAIKRASRLIQTLGGNVISSLKSRTKDQEACVAAREDHPSQETDQYWLVANRISGSYPRAGAQSGKWLIFLPIAEIDEAWSKIREATESGRFGNASKVATAKPNPNVTDSKTKVICIYTYDWSDERDVRRIRQELRALGFLAKLSYKADADTLSGKYAVRGAKRISNPGLTPNKKQLYKSID